MILPDFKAFPRMGRIIGLDWGARRIGVAVSDPRREFVFARDLIPGGADASHRIADFVRTERAVGVIVGLPLHADGTPSDTTRAVRAFADELTSNIDVPICFVEENLTSVAAQESMGKVRRRDIKEKLDSLSARVILENAIAMINRA